MCCVTYYFLWIVIQRPFMIFWSFKFCRSSSVVEIKVLILILHHDLHLKFYVAGQKQKKLTLLCHLRVIMIGWLKRCPTINPQTVFFKINNTFKGRLKYFCDKKRCIILKRNMVKIVSLVLSFVFIFFLLKHLISISFIRWSMVKRWK